MRFKNPKTSTWDLIGASGGSSGDSPIIFSKKADFPIVGESDKFYIDVEKNESYIYTDDYHLVGDSCKIAVVSTLPDTLVADKLYVNTSDKSITYYDGSNSTVIVPETVGVIDDTSSDTDLANVKAIKDFIKAQIAKIPTAKDYTIKLEDATAGENELTKQILKQGESGKETEVGTISVPKLVMDTSVTENNMAATYKFIYGGAEVGKVNIPKDLVVTQDGSEIIRVDDDHPVSGLNNGVYLKLMIQNSINPVYIDVKDLGGTYTGKIVTNGISVSVSDANEISATLVGKTVSESNLSDELTKKINSQSDWEQTDTTADDYIKNKPTFNELTKADIEAWLGLSPEELEGLASLINDDETRIDKVWSSSKTYTELQKISQKAKSAYEIAVKNGFKGTEEEWLESLFPSINPTTKTWIINGVDTKISAEGRSIKTITKDDNNNIIVTFSDKTTQNIGKLEVDVQADFLTEDGFGKLRYYNGHFQYHDENSDSWVDTSVTPENVYVMNMTPQPMKAMACNYDKLNGKLRIKFAEPDDTILDGQAFCIVEKVVIRRKIGSVPTDENDGELVTEVLRRDFGNYSKLWFVDEDVTPNIGDTYYYKAFPMSTTGFYNYSELNEASITCKETVLYGFKIDQNESDPASMITYLPECDNAQYASAYMDYSADTFNYGDWENAFFIAGLKPCMLKYDGTVDYELDKNDYTKKIDGAQSDVANRSYGGNVMIGFPKVYWKIVDNGDDTANVYISDTKLDDGFVCWSHLDNNGMEIDYCYMPAYTGALVDGILRSLSGLAPMTGMTRRQEIDYAKANNIAEKLIWYTEVYSDRTLIVLLLLLIGKSTDTQTVFGTGNNSSYVSESNTGVINSGTMNTKGLFWGSNDNVSGVKVFGMEHFWGNTWRAVAGWINDNGTQKVKMTYGKGDGSTVDGYNLDGAGYISIPNSTLSGTNGGYISKMLITDNGLIPTIVSGSASTYYCDGLWLNNSIVDYVIVGGASGTTARVGALCSRLDSASSSTYWAFGASLSCKPLATS